ncbi:hypothetical protein DM02DRAFT_478022, partial [Periconia macrospinosa]
MNWLNHHQPTLRFGQTRSMSFDSDMCQTNCLQGHCHETVHDHGPPASETTIPKGDGDVQIISAAATFKMLKRDPENCVWVEPHQW